MKVSVIVPVEHREPYVSRCIKSILAQTQSDLEIILAGRPGCAEETCESFEKDFPNVHYLLRRSEGMPGVINRALDIARGEYVCFVDSDDRIIPGYVSFLVDLAEDNDARISMCACRQYRWGDDEEFLYNEDEYGQEMIGPDEFLTRYFSGKDIAYSARFCKLFRKELFQGFDFRFGTLFGEETELARVVRRADRIAVSHLPIYFYTIRKGAVKTRETFSLEYAKALGGLEDSVAFFEGGRDTKLLWLAQEKYLTDCMRLYNLIDSDVEDAKEHKKALMNRYSEMLKKAKKNRDRDKARISRLSHYKLFPGDFAKKEKGSD